MGTTLLALLSAACHTGLGVLKAATPAEAVSAKHCFHRCWPPPYWHFRCGQPFLYRIQKRNHSKVIATDCCLNRFSVVFLHQSVKQLFWADLFSGTEFNTFVFLLYLDMCSVEREADLPV